METLGNGHRHNGTDVQSSSSSSSPKRRWKSHVQCFLLTVLLLKFAYDNANEVFGLSQLLPSLNPELQQQQQLQQVHKRSQPPQSVSNTTTKCEPKTTTLQRDSKVPAAVAEDVAPFRPNHTHWCVFDRDQMYIKLEWLTSNIAHCSEFLLPCWSWFREQNATLNCGFVLGYGESFRPNNQTTWFSQLIDAMGCQVRELPIKRLPRNKRPLGDKEPIQHIPNLIHLRPRFGMFRYLNRPEDAWALRRLLVSDETIAQTKGKGFPLRIGALQRPKGRRVGNLEEIVDLLQSRYPHNSTAEISLFDNMTLQQQAEFFATKDVIIAPHGAGLVNSIFCTPGTLVMQIYPPRFFLQTLDPLIEQVGAIALDWYNGSRPIMDWVEIRDAPRGWIQHNQLRNAEINPPPQEVVEKILAALGHQPWTNAHQVRWPSNSR